MTNERIQELIEHATTKESFYPAGCNGHHEDRYYFDKEKFAQLVIQECADQATWHQGTMAKDIGGELLKYFGVEK